MRKMLLVFGIGAVSGAVGMLTYGFTLDAKERYPEKTTWEAIKRLADREMWWATQR